MNSDSLRSIRIATQLISLTNAGSQLGYIKDLFEEIFSCDVSLWISETILFVLKNELNNNLEDYTKQPTKLMGDSIEIMSILPIIESNAVPNDSPLTVAVPLVKQAEVLGAIQLEKKRGPGFSKEEIGLINELCLQIASALDKRRKEVFSDQDKKKLDLMSLIAQINKSITSNLDLENLINSLLTLIYRSLPFDKVNIYISLDDEKQVFTLIGITDDGIEIPRLFLSQESGEEFIRAISTLETLIINIEPKRIMSPLSPGSIIGSTLIIPMVTGDQLIGVLEFWRNPTNSFESYEVDILQNLGEQISVAIRNAKLFRSEQIRRQMIEDLNEEIASLTVETTVEEICESILIEIDRYISFDIAGIWTVEEKKENIYTDPVAVPLHLIAVNISENYYSMNSEGNDLDIDTIKNNLREEEETSNIQQRYPWLLEVLLSEIPLVCNAALPEEPLGREIHLLDIHSAIGIPLRKQNKLLGMMLLVNHQPHFYLAEACEVSFSIASFISVVIENTRLFSEAHDQVWTSTVLLQVADTLRSIDSLDELFETIVRTIIDLIGASACVLYLWDDLIKVYSPQVSSGFDERLQSTLNEIDIPSGSVIAFDQLIENNLPVVLSPENFYGENISQSFIGYDFSANLLILFPLTTQEKNIGAFLIDFSGTKIDKNSPQKIWDDLYTTIQAVAQYSAASIESLQTIKSREEEAYISIALLQVAQAIVSLNQLDEILGAIVRITPILVGVKRCIIYMWDKQNLVLHPTHYFGFSKTDLQFDNQYIRLSEYPFIHVIFNNNQIAYYKLPPNASPAEWSDIESADVHVVNGTYGDYAVELSVKIETNLQQEKARLLIGFPIGIKEEILGVMIIEEENPIKGSSSYHIREKKIEIVRGITQQAAVAIKNEQLLQEAVNSERMERELQLAREIQETFLPHRLPVLPGWEIDAFWQPARQAAGDFYDILSFENNKLGLVIADVADKGMPAALFMTLIRTLIRAAAKENISPAIVLAQVNDLLLNDSKNGMFVTVFYAVLDLESGKVVYANAGHNPSIVKHAGTENLIELSRTSIALGIFPEIDVSEEEVLLSSGDWMLLYTDGVTEAFSITDEMYGIDRLYTLLLHTQFLTSKDIVDNINLSVQEFVRGAELSDDLTIAAILKK